MTTIGYIRHSTAEQGERTSPALQKREIKRCAASHGLDVDEWFTDSTRRQTPLARRPGLGKALSRLTPGSKMFVYRLDRLAGTVELQSEFFKLASKVGARIISSSGEGTNGNGNEQDDPDAKFLRKLSALLAEHETDRLGKRIRDALRAKKSQGTKWNGSAPYGHRWTPAGKLAVNVAEQRTIRLVVELRDEGVTFRGVCEELTKRRRFNRAGGVFVVGQIQRILRRQQDSLTGDSR